MATIGNLQVLRALAALGVVFYHTDYRIVADVHTDYLGVATFFVISGFIMCFITKDDADGFLVNRMIRIVPLYWLCTIALIVIGYRSGLLRPSTWTTTTTLATDLPRSLLFLPSEKTPLLGVGWTLNFEMYFYVVFAAALWLSRPFAPLITSAVILAVIAIDHAAPDVFLARYYSHAYVCFFLGGIALFYLWRFAADRLPKTPTAIVCAGGLVFSYAIQAGMPAPGLWTYTLPLMIVGSALFMASAGADIKWKPLTLLGDASYALYLTHTIAMEFFRRLTDAGVLPSPKTDLMSMLLVVSCCIAISVCVHLWIEKPMGRAIKERLRRRAYTAASATSI
jgi:exopolysaccharide production protein ExoZ